MESRDKATCGELVDAAKKIMGIHLETALVLSEKALNFAIENTFSEYIGPASFLIAEINKNLEDRKLEHSEEMDRIHQMNKPNNKIV